MISYYLMLHIEIFLFMSLLLIACVRMFTVGLLPKSIKTSFKIHLEQVGPAEGMCE